ncbi:DUF7535 family protein [Halostella litorea]|uniref:DUF7535 family protein n=1 Tax=Halostella litorea TaxID=2528831 RepID=UPI00109263BD|nr:hypothetical protein [Halostella litorea]
MPRTVTELSGWEQNTEMSLIGYLLGAGTALLMLPLLPFLAVLWVFDRLFGGDRTGRAADSVDYRPD